jgi:hypothetical protein
VAATFPGFSFGRFDLRGPSAEAIAGGDFRVIELNGVTSEATHIYDPRHSVFYGWRTLCHQWRLAFEIGAAHRAAGARPTPAWELLRAALAYRRQARGQGRAPAPPPPERDGDTG